MLTRMVFLKGFYISADNVLTLMRTSYTERSEYEWP